MPYWVNTSNNALIHRLLKQIQKSHTEELKSLLEGNLVEAIINPEITYKDIEKSQNNPNEIYRFLLTCGYLNAQESQIQRARWQVKLKIPNEELYCIFEDEILRSLNENLWSDNLFQFLEALLQQKIDRIERFLSQILMESISSFDTLENFYHGLLLGLVVALRRTTTSAAIGRAELVDMIC